MDSLILYRKLVASLISIPSIAGQASSAAEIEHAATVAAQIFQEQGYKVRVLPTAGSPLVLAHYEVRKDLPTALIYGHYDVQPAAATDGWTVPPFALSEKNGCLYGRGIADNKGQFLIHVAAIAAHIQAGTLGYNVYFLIEGEEEIGSPHFAAALSEQRAAIPADFAVISDGEFSPGEPQLEVAFRGACSATLRLTTATQAVHAGTYGGTIPNAAHELSQLVAQLHTADGQVAVPGYYEGCVNGSPAPAHQTYQEATIQEIAGVASLLIPTDQNAETVATSQPTLQVTSLTAGYQGDGYQSAIPAWAEAKLNFRFAPGQDANLLLEKVRQFLADQIPSYAHWEMVFDHLTSAVEIPHDAPILQRAAAVLTSVYGTSPAYVRCGGSLPPVTAIKEILAIPQVIVPLANNDCHMHGVDENLRLDFLEKGLAFSSQFFATPTPS